MDSKAKVVDNINTNSAVNPDAVDGVVKPEMLKPEMAKTETGGPKGPEPTRYGDWEIAGKCVDF